MIFTSFLFAGFMTMVFLIYWKIKNRYRWILLGIVNCLFYIGFGVQNFLLLLLVIFISYLGALTVGKCKKRTIRSILVGCIVVLMISLLGYFKYYSFILDNINLVLKPFTLQLHKSTVAIIAPVGISFYTFKVLSYIIDVYKGQMPEYNLAKYMIYVSFFLEVSSGPIDRSKQFLSELEKDKIFSYEKVTYGLKLTAWGLFKKIIVADTLAFYVDWIFGGYESYRGFTLFLISIFFSIQIYCDFSGYSDMAIGLAKMLDINIIDNFKSPYFAVSVREFWQRWHISLSFWLRDYIYIPLGGSRKGKFRQQLNLIITFLVSGIWHGANWTYIVWGGIHGISQVVSRVFPKVTGKRKNNLWFRSVKTGIVFLFCNFAWIFFRADTMQQAIYFFSHMFDGIMSPKNYIIQAQRDLNIDIFMFCKIVIMIMLVYIYDLINKDNDAIGLLCDQKKGVRWSIYSTFIFIMIIFLPVTPGTDFLYFQF